MPPIQQTPQAPIGTPPTGVPQPFISQQSSPPGMPEQPIVPQPELEKPSRKKWPVLTAVLIVVLLLGGGAAYVALSYSKYKKPQATQLTSVTVPATTTSSLTAAQVAAMDKETTFWGYFKNAAMQSQLVTDHLETETGTAGKVTYRKLGFDYATKKLQFAIDETLNGTVYSKDRCYDGKHYSSVGTDWHDVTDPSSEDQTCDLKHLPEFSITDGVNTGGLNATQADTFVNYLRSKQGLTQVNSLRLETHAGKQYLHYSVDFVPIPHDNDYGGNYWFGVAFRSTGLNPDTWPYGKSGIIGGGTHLDYDVDPATSLPAYSLVSAQPLKAASGKNEPLNDFTITQTLYHFGVSTFDVTTSNNANLTFNW